MTTTLPVGYDWASLILLPIVAAVLIGIIYTASFKTTSGIARIAAIVAAIIIVGVFIYALVASYQTITPQTVSATVQATEDPFTYDPGATPNGVVMFAGNGSAFSGNQYNCGIKSSSTIWNAASATCQCRLGFYGTMCEFEAFSDRYVSLTSDTVFTTPSGPPSMPAPSLSTWPAGQTTEGCTNMCDTSNACLGVTYANGVCTQLTSISFSQAPIQTVTLDPPVLPTTVYLNRSRLHLVNMSGYFNVIFGTLPTRYFVGNFVASSTGSNIHITGSGTRINYYAIGVSYTFSGIPDYIIVNTTGVLNLSVSPIPARADIVPGGGSVVQFTTPLTLTKANFPFSVQGRSYYVRLDTPS